MMTWMRGVGAGMLIAGLLGLTNPAIAGGRGLVEDSPVGFPLPTPKLGACSLGSACGGFDLRYDAWDNGFGHIGSFGGKVFIYNEGVVAFGKALPLDASIAGGTRSLGDGDWFAPSFGDPLKSASYHSGINNMWTNWFDDAGAVRFQIAFQYIGPGGAWDPRDPSLTHYAILFSGPGRAGGDTVAFNYNAHSAIADEQRAAADKAEAEGNDDLAATLRRAAGNLERNTYAFSCSPPTHSPLTRVDAFIGLGCADSSNANLPGREPPTGGVPEPAGWALMICGLGSIGVALRRRKAIAVV